MTAITVIRCMTGSDSTVTDVTVAWSVRRSVCMYMCMSLHSHTLLKLLDEMRCHFVGTCVVPMTGRVSTPTIHEDHFQLTALT